MAAIKLAREKAEVDLARARIHASSLQGTRADAQKQLGDTSKRLKEAEESIRRLESELKKSREAMKRRMIESETMRLELEKLKAEKAGDKMEVTDANTQARRNRSPSVLLRSATKQ